MKNNTISKSKIYSLHSKIKKEGYRYDSRTKTIYVGFSNRGTLTNTVLLLRDKYGYSIQTEIE